MDINPRQLRLLKAIKKSKVVRTEKHYLEDVEYLRENGLVVAATYDKNNDFFYMPSITEKGDAFLYVATHQSRRSNITLVLSLVAILLSILTAFTPFPDWAKAFLVSLMP